MKTSILYRIVFSLALVAMALSACAPATETAIPEPTENTPVEVTLWTPNGKGDVQDWAQDPILDEIEAATNTVIVPSHYDWDAFQDQVATAASSNELPGIIGVIDHTQVTILNSMATNGVIAPFEGEVAAAAPNLMALYESDPVLNELKVDGKIYFVPVSWGNGNYPNMGLFHVRQDLLDKYGMAAPDTFDEYFAYLQTCQESGDGSGVIFAAKDTGINLVLSGFAGAYGLPTTGWVETEDGYGYWAVQPGMKDALMLFREMLPYVDPAAWSSSEDDARAIYVSGQACSLIFNGGGHIGRIQNDMALVNPDFQELLLPALDNGAGTRGYTVEPMFWGVVAIGASPNDDPVAAARVINYLLSPEGYKLTAVGILDRDYTEEDGVITLTDQRARDGFPTTAGDTGFHPAANFISWVPQEWQNWQLSYGKDQAYVDWFNQMWENQGMYQTPISYGMVATSPKWTEFQATGSDLMTRAFIDIVRAADDATAAELFDQFVQAWMSSGGADATTEMSAKLSEMYR